MAGDVGFDPLGLSNIDDVEEAEIKQCRVAMMAVAGMVWVELFGPAPGWEAATAKCQTDAFWQIWNSHPQYIAASFVFIVMAEAVSGIATCLGRESGDREPGDFGFGKQFSSDDMKAKEILMDVLLCGLPLDFFFRDAQTTWMELRHWVQPSATKLLCEYFKACIYCCQAKFLAVSCAE